MTDLSLLTEAIATAYEDRDTRPIHEWATDHVWLPLGGSAQPGRFNAASARHVIDVLADMRDPLVRQVNILKPIQSVGTTAAEVWVLWVLCNEPGPTQFNFNSKQVQESNWEKRLKPMIRTCEQLSKLLPEDARKLKQNGVIFTNGIPLTTQNATEGNLQSDSVRNQVNDEVWQWDPGMFKEADARVEAFRRVGMSKQVNISQAGVDGSDWHRICFGAGTSFSEWEVACPHCGVYQVMRMQVADGSSTRYLMKWDDDGGGIRYECPHCGKAMEDSAKLKAHFNASGRYRDHSPLMDRRTRRWNALTWSPWADLVREYREALAAKKMGVLLPLQQFLQKRLAEFWKADDMAPIVRPAFCDDEAPAACQSGSIRGMTIDTHEHFFPYLIREWESDGASRLLTYGRARNIEELEQIRQRFKVPAADWQGWLRWTRGNRNGPRPSCLSRVMIDTGGHRAQEVYDACWRHGWIGTKGTDKEFYTHTDAKGRQSTRLVAPQSEILNYESKGSYLPLLLLASTGAKDILANLRDGKGRPWRAPATIGEAYLREINSEAKELVGPGKWRWKQIGQRNNEAWDLEYMQVVIASEAGIFKL